MSPNLIPYIVIAVLSLAIFLVPMAITAMRNKPRIVRKIVINQGLSYPDLGGRE